MWDPRVVKPLYTIMLYHSATFSRLVPAVYGLRDGGIGSSIPRELAERCRDQDSEPRVTILGIPTAYIAQGKPDAILASLGLDAQGIAASVRASLHR